MAAGAAYQAQSAGSHVFSFDVSLIPEYPQPDVTSVTDSRPLSGIGYRVSRLTSEQNS
jgi:hypothetical protein